MVKKEYTVLERKAAKQCLMLREDGHYEGVVNPGTDFPAKATIPRGIKEM